MSSALMEARGVRKTYTLGKRKLEVLRGVDLTIQAGDFVALRGASGAGKSTLLHLLGGLDLPNAGEILFNGQNLRQRSSSGLARFRNEKVGFIFQAYHLLPELSAIENVMLAARISRVPAAEAESRSRELLTRVGLAERLDHRPYELSGGEQQRVVISRALINRPQLILADEPTGNLDSHTGDEIMQLLCSLKDEGGAALIMATHDSRIAARAQRIIHLVDGEITASGA